MANTHSPKFSRTNQSALTQHMRRAAIRYVHACLQLNCFKALGTPYRREDISSQDSGWCLWVRSRCRYAPVKETPHARFRNVNLIPFRGAFYEERFLRYGFHRAPQDRLTHDQLLFTWNPYPRRSTRLSLVCLLLPPRSVSATAPPGLTSKASTPSPHSSYS